MYRLLKIRYLVIGFAGFLSGGLCLLSEDRLQPIDYFFNDCSSDSIICGKASVKEDSLIAGGFGLKFVEAKCSLPQLRTELVFKGINRRPDAIGQGILLAFRKGNANSFLSLGKKYFINFKKIGLSESLGLEEQDFDINYYFDEKVTCGPLWLEITHVSDDGLSLGVKVEGDFKNGPLGEVRTEVEEFILCAERRDFCELEEWFLGEHKVDASFPMKQKMRRIGKDLFMLMHGGADYLDCLAKERFDFVCDNVNYCRFLGVNDYLAWNGKIWVEPRFFEGNVEDTPILFLKKMDEKGATLEIWDRGGIRRQLIQLVRYPHSPLECEELAKEIEYVGLKTWNGPTILTATGERLSLKPNDWLLRSSSGWRKLQSSEDLNDYLSGKLVEPLFVFNGMEKVENTYVLKGHLFDSLRAHVLPITLSLKNRTTTEDTAVGQLSSAAKQQPFCAENGR